MLFILEAGPRRKPVSSAPARYGLQDGIIIDRLS